MPIPPSRTRCPWFEPLGIICPNGFIYFIRLRALSRGTTNRASWNAGPLRNEYVSVHNAHSITEEHQRITPFHGGQRTLYLALTNGALDDAAHYKTQISLRILRQLEKQPPLRNSCESESDQCLQGAQPALDVVFRELAWRFSRRQAPNAKIHACLCSDHQSPHLGFLCLLIGAIVFLCFDGACRTRLSGGRVQTSTNSHSLGRDHRFEHWEDGDHRSPRQYRLRKVYRKYRWIETKQNTTCSLDSSLGSGRTNKNLLPSRAAVSKYSA